MKINWKGCFQCRRAIEYITEKGKTKKRKRNRKGCSEAPTDFVLTCLAARGNVRAIIRACVFGAKRVVTEFLQMKLPSNLLVRRDCLRPHNSYLTTTPWLTNMLMLNHTSSKLPSDGALVQSATEAITTSRSALTRGRHLRRSKPSPIPAPRPSPT